MKPSIWYTVEERQPPKTGYYVAFKGMSMGDDETGVAEYYWNQRTQEWRDSSVASIGRWANVCYWCDAYPQEWYDQDSKRGQKTRTVTPAEKAAWDAVVKAMEQYEIIKALTQ